MKRLLLLLLLLTASVSGYAQPSGVMPQRIRITSENAGDVSLYMLLSRRADRVVWSPGASVLAVVDGSDIDLYRVSDWLAAPQRIRLDQALTDLVFSPDGQLLFTLIPGSVVAWGTSDAAMRDRFIADARRIAVSPNGLQVALLSRQNIVQVVTLETRETFSLSPSIAADDLAFSSDSRRLLISDGTGGAEVIGLALRQSERVMSGTGKSPAVALLGSAAFSGDGRRIFSQAAEGTESIWVWDARSGELLGAMNRPAEYQRVYGWGINTRANIATGAAVGLTPEQNAVLLWTLSGGEPIARLRHPGARDSQLSPDGTLIASVGGGTLRLWTAAESLPTPDQAALLSQVNVVAACDVFGVQPSLGEVLDGQSVSLVWSWYAVTAQQVRDYLDAALVRLDLDAANIRPWVFVSKTLPDDANGGNPTVYLYAPVGVLLRGQHLSRVEVTWVVPINDGYADFGPGTANLADGGTCAFSVR